MSEYGVITEKGTIQFERMLPGPIERVWDYLTDPEKRATWLAGGPMELRVGGHVELRFRHSDLAAEREEVPEKYRMYGDETSFTGTVTQCEPPHLLSYTWAESWGDASEVTFQLIPENDHVRLVLTHRRLPETEMLSVAAGWHAHLNILVDRAEGRPSRGFWGEHERFESEYEQRLSVA